jgi:flagella basal body P-ring formation protein FlgA
MAQRLLRWFYLLQERPMSYAFTRLVGLGVLSCAFTAPCTAAAFYPLADIRVAVADFLQSQTQNSAQKVQIEVGQLDARLRLAACVQPLSLTLPPGARLQGMTSVSVKCEAPSPWSLFVPATIRREFGVLVAKQNIPRGKILTESDLKLEVQVLTNMPPGAIAEVSSAVGQLALRAISAGAPVNQSALKARETVRRGQTVTLSLDSGPIAIAVSGTALQGGAVGERIAVRNNNSKRVVEGVIQDSGVVVVEGGYSGE